jgi:LmbE family N-acetylglucosaminyl deacetylase
LRSRQGAVAPNQVVVISPHLDDAAFSIGAFIHRQVRLGSEVSIITALSCDPEPQSSEPGWWDAMCGFDSPARAARARREEDARAARILGATPIWLPYGDMTYGRGAPDHVIWADLAAAIGVADTVLLPGYPLSHPDHLWVTNLVLKHRHEFGGKIGFYAEQPYVVAALIRSRNGRDRPTKRGQHVGLGQFLGCILSRAGPPSSALLESHVLKQQITWQTVRAAALDRHAKRRAIASYRSQLRPLGIGPVLGGLIYEAVRRGETIAWANDDLVLGGDRVPGHDPTATETLGQRSRPRGGPA